ncbi:hypothetical protein DH2020_035793 [Rehmannia glutinosa]|uniref:UDP-glycosyltransferases domain-containing protein n=1 Tax=Rehmannia glutinosa TaxID=99300 RepID=A0ABR0V7M6_REHGL
MYLCSSRVNLDSIKTSIDQKDSSFDVKLVELYVPSLPQLPPEMHTTKNLPFNLIPTLVKAFQMSTSSFSDILNSVKPDLLIYDLFQPWAPKLASSKNIPSVYFSTVGATSYTFYHHVYTMGIGSPFPYPTLYLKDHEWVDVSDPGVTQSIKGGDEDDFAFGILTMSDDIVLVKSSREVEEKYIDYLSVLSKKQIVHTEEELPVWFIETVKERGLVIPGWAPQTKILAHPSVGGFVSHCGWSSVTESMYFGVPVIAMPMRSEQPINARLLVEAGVGVEVEKDGNGHFVGEDVAKAINKVIVEKEFYEGMRDRAKRLSEKIKENAEQEMNEVAEQLLRICMKNKKQV